MPGYQGKVAVVTGAASGIGYAVAARAAAEGMTVVLADIDAIRARAEGIIAGRNPADDSVDPNFRRSTGQTPS